MSSLHHVVELPQRLTVGHMDHFRSITTSLLDTKVHLGGLTPWTTSVYSEITLKGSEGVPFLLPVDQNNPRGLSLNTEGSRSWLLLLQTNLIFYRGLFKIYYINLNNTLHVILGKSCLDIPVERAPGWKGYTKASCCYLCVLLTLNFYVNIV